METPVTANPVSAQETMVSGRNCRPWSDEEIARLEKMAPQKCTYRQLIKAFPDRGLKTIKKQLTRARLNLGIRRPHPRQTDGEVEIIGPYSDDGDEDDRAWRKQCIVSNQAFLRAIQRAGALA